MSEAEMREAIDRMLEYEDYAGIRCIYFMLLGRAGSQPGVQEELKKIAPWTFRKQKPPYGGFFLCRGVSLVLECSGQTGASRCRMRKLCISGV